MIKMVASNRAASGLLAIVLAATMTGCQIAKVFNNMTRSESYEMKVTVPEHKGPIPIKIFEKDYKQDDKKSGEPDYFADEVRLTKEKNRVIYRF